MDTFVAAVDLGASSGRVLLACLGAARETLSIEEVHRFDNGFVHRDGHDCWDVDNLVAQINVGLERIVDRGIKLASVGVDTWAVDFVLLDADGKMLGQPVAYRDHRTDGVMDEVFKTIPREKLYERTGIAFLQFNTIYQLVALMRENPDWLPRARTLLLMPDYLQYRLCGTQSCEATNASTSQLISVKTKSWDIDLLRSLGIPLHWFLPLTQPGTVIGEWVSPNGSRVKVITPATHDTASAVLAVPLEDEDSVYISSGTWSLMGIESDVPYCDERALAANFTNEGGIEGTTRFLKNICGMWIYERCRKEWKDEAAANQKDMTCLGHAELIAEAMKQPAFQSIINPDDTCFANPSSMVEAIKQYCEKTGQHVPQSYGEFCRCIFESLALRYRQVFTWLKDFADIDLNVLHIIGGGSLNQYLNQFTANSCGVTVLAGPQEGTAIGNIMLQAKASGLVKDIWEMRQIIANSLELKTFEPQNKEAWDAAYEKFLKVKK